MIRIEKLVHKYTVWESDTKKSMKTVLDGISFDIPSGQFLAILGPNGCGKSTLAKHLNVLLLPESGTVWIDGKKTDDSEKLWQIREEVGMVFQNPDNQIVGTSVEEDIAFGPENRNVPSEEIQRRVTSSLEAVSLTHKRMSSPSRLSGGQKQRVAIAGTIVGDASCIVFDEPTAMLDPSARREVMGLIRYLNKEKGMTVVLITHHTDEVVDADSILLMERGQVVAQGTPAEIFANTDLLRKVKMDTPQVTELAEKLHQAGLPVAIPALHEEQLVEQLSGLLKKGGIGEATQTVLAAEPQAPAILEVDKVAYVYNRGTVNECSVLQDISFSIHPGECIGLIGASGSGKTTLIKQLNGLLKATSGDIRFEGQSIYRKKYNLTALRKEVGLVFQYPEHQLFGRTVMADACFGPLNMGMSREAAEAAAKEALKLVDIGEEYYYSNPLEMSGGQKRRVAIAGVLAMDPKVLILDEPAAGLDPETKHMIFDLLTRIKQERNIAIVLVSHHMEDVAQYADRVIVLDQGRLALNNSPAQVFCQSEQLRQMGIGIPQITSITEGLIRRGVVLSRPAVTVEDAVEMLVPLYEGRKAGV